MGSLQTVLPFKLAVTDESLTAHGGLALFGEYLRAMGVCSLIDHELPGPRQRTGIHPFGSCPAAYSHACGRRTDAGRFARAAQ